MSRGSFGVDGRHDQSQQTFTDLCVGFRLRLRRKMLGLELAELADMAQISVADLQGMEDGDKRLSASSLFEFCKLLEVPVAWFFEGADAKIGPVRSNDIGANSNTAAAAAVRDQQDEALLRFYFDHISEQQLRHLLLEFARVLAEGTTAITNARGN